MFVMPLPRGEGYANLVWQAQEERVLFKTLEGFQLLPKTSTPVSYHAHFP